MAEYIEREALKNDFCNACSTHKRYHRTFDECRNKIDPDGNRCFKMRLIDNAPTADVAEVRRGEWLYHECVSSHDGAISGYSCSECSGFVYEEIFDMDEFHKNFCGNCGADMRGRNKIL